MVNGYLNRLGEIERVFDKLNGLSDWAFGYSSSEGTNAKLLSMQKDEKSYTLRYWIPATRKDQLTCELDAGRLEIRWSVDDKDVKARGFVYPQVVHGNWRLNLTVPEDVVDDPGLVYEAEVLTITFKRSSASKRKQIRVN